MTTEQTKVAIIYGGAEGSKHGQELRQALNSAGYKVIDKPESADVLIVHSGGGLLLPPLLKAKLVLLIGFPFWPDKPLVKSITQKVVRDVKLHHKGWIRKNLQHIFYFFAKPRYLTKMWQVWRQKQFLFPEAPRFIMIRNQDDPFMEPVESLAFGQDRGWHVETLPGPHDDIWINPAPYVKIIKKYYGKSD